MPRERLLLLPSVFSVSSGARALTAAALGILAALPAGCAVDRTGLLMGSSPDAAAVDGPFHRADANLGSGGNGDGGGGGSEQAGGASGSGGSPGGTGGFLDGTGGSPVGTGGAGLDGAGGSFDGTGGASFTGTGGGTFDGLGGSITTGPGTGGAISDGLGGSITTGPGTGGASAPGTGGSACPACAACERCSSSGACELDPASQWDLTAVSAVLNRNDPYDTSPGGGPWDLSGESFGGPRPDPFCQLEMPLGTAIFWTSSLVDSLAPTWNEPLNAPGTTLTAADLLPGGMAWQIWVGDDDGGGVGEVMCEINAPLAAADFKAGGFTRTNVGSSLSSAPSCTSVTLKLTCHP